MNKNIKVLHGGFFTTVQDSGRFGYQKFGISVAGVMDEYSHKLSNALVGNALDEAVLETTYLGPMLKFEEDMLIAITGAETSPCIDGVEIPTWTSVLVKAGSLLSFKKLKSGVRSYIAFAGGIDVPIVNGSKSTLVKSKIGGYMGRALKKDDELSIAVNSSAIADRKIQNKYIPDFSRFNEIRVVLGPQDDYFSAEETKKLFRSGYTLTEDLDRMGIRLDGAKISHINTADIISDGTVKGSIQIPANGSPIILMADRQTTGGYTKIGTVIREDIVHLAQMGAFSKIIFSKISLEDAQKKYIAFDAKINEAIESME